MIKLKFVCTEVNIKPKRVGQPNLLVELDIDVQSIRDQSRELLDLIYELDPREFKEYATRIIQ